MKKSSFMIFCIGIVAGLITASIGTYAEWDLNPQMEYTMNPEDLVWLFYGGFSAISCPFFLIALILQCFPRVAK